MKFCQDCGKENPDEAPRCVACGSALGAASKPRLREATRDQDPAGAAGLLVDPSLWRVKRRDTTSARLSKASAIAAAQRHYLVPPMGSPLRIDVRSQPYVLGRDEECDVVIDSAKVSRRHCELSFRESPPRAFVKDLGTKNGTYLNGVPIEGDKALYDGDSLGLSDVVATYRTLEPGADEASLVARSSKKNETAPMIARESVFAALNGELALYPIAQLLLNLTKLRASGTLLVESDGVTHTLAFKDGNATDEATFDRISTLEKGRFRFEPTRRS